MSTSEILLFHHLVASRLCGLAAVRSLNGVVVEKTRRVAFVLAQTPTAVVVFSVAIDAKAVTGHLTIPFKGMQTWDIALAGPEANFRIYISVSNKLLVLEHENYENYCSTDAIGSTGTTNGTNWCYDNITAPYHRGAGWWWWIPVTRVLVAIASFLFRTKYISNRKKYVGYSRLKLNL